MQIKDYSRKFLITIYNENTIIVHGKNFTYYLYSVINQEISDTF